MPTALLLSLLLVLVMSLMAVSHLEILMMVGIYLLNQIQVILVL